MTKIPERYAGLLSAVGPEVPADHPIAHGLELDNTIDQECMAAEDERYRLVFMNGRMQWEENRRAELHRLLACPAGYWYGDAEVQAAANILSHPETRLLAAASQRMKPGARCSDYVLVAPTTVEIEVRVLQESAEEMRLADIEQSIRSRLEAISRPDEILMELCVCQVQSQDGCGLMLHDAAKKALVGRVKAVIAEGKWKANAVVVTLKPDGTAEVCSQFSSRFGELASVTVQKSKLAGVVLSWSGLQPPHGFEEVVRALKRKRERKQRSGNHPWVIVLDYSINPFLESDRIIEGVRASLASSRHVSAVAIQSRRLFSGRFGQCERPWVFTLESICVTNPHALHPLTAESCRLFEHREAKSVSTRSEYFKKR